MVVGTAWAAGASAAAQRVPSPATRAARRTRREEEREKAMARSCRAAAGRGGHLGARVPHLGPHGAVAQRDVALRVRAPRRAASLRAWVLRLRVAAAFLAARRRASGVVT